MSALERMPEVAASVPDEKLGPGTDWRGIPRGPLQLAWRLDFLRQHEQVHEIPFVS